MEHYNDIAALGKTFDDDADARRWPFDRDGARPGERRGDFIARRWRGRTRDLPCSHRQAVELLQARARVIECLE